MDRQKIIKSKIWSTIDEETKYYVIYKVLSHHSEVDMELANNYVHKFDQLTSNEQKQEREYACSWLKLYLSEKQRCKLDIKDNEWKTWQGMLLIQMHNEQLTHKIIFLNSQHYQLIVIVDLRMIQVSDVLCFFVLLFYLMSNDRS